MEADRQSIRDLMQSGLTGNALLIASGMRKTLFYRRLQEVRSEIVDAGTGQVVQGFDMMTPGAFIADGDSLRSRLLRAVVAAGPFGDSKALSRYIRKPTDNYGFHEVMHILFALNKDGLIAMNENTRGNQKDITNIRARTAAYRELGYPVPKSNGSDKTDYNSHRSVAQGGPITHRKVEPEVRQNEKLFPVTQRDRDIYERDALATEPALSEPEPATPEQVATAAIPSAWPVLDDLRSRVVQSVKNAQAAELLMQAAELTGDMSLMERAAVLDESLFTEAESEYLAYADANDPLK
jgi:hypothetical protein